MHRTQQLVEVWVVGKVEGQGTHLHATAQHSTRQQVLDAT
jgi:hypothetical protein